MRRTPLLSTAPKPTTNEERAEAFEFLYSALAVTTVGVVCDFTRNSLTFYVNDEIIHTTRIAFHAGKWKESTAKPQPFEWLIPKEKANLRACRVYLALWCAHLNAEFVEWTPPTPPKSHRHH